MDINILTSIQETLKRDLRLSSVFILSEESPFTDELRVMVKRVKNKEVFETSHEVVSLFEEALEDQGLDAYIPYDGRAIVLLDIDGSCVAALCVMDEVKLVMCTGLIETVRLGGIDCVTPFSQYIDYGFEVLENNIERMQLNEEYNSIGKAVDEALAHVKPLPNSASDYDYYEDDDEDPDVFGNML